jgi:uncharacterized protein YjbJ (UPF0337 family)
VPTRSDREDKNEGKTDRVKGRMKEAGGALTGDKSMKREGRSDQRKRKANEKTGAAKDLLSQRRHRFGQRSRRVEVLRISALSMQNYEALAEEGPVKQEHVQAHYQRHHHRGHRGGHAVVD